MKALNYMRNGRVPGLSWNWVSYRDLWPANVFLVSNDVDGYPRAKLADFGSNITRDDCRDRAFPVLRRQPHFAPLNQVVLSGRGYIHQQIAEGTDQRNDVYQFGLIVVAVCRQTLCPKDYKDWLASSPADSSYSTRLNQTVTECLRPVISHRPTAAILVSLLRTPSTAARNIEDLWVGKTYVGRSGNLVTFTRRLRVR